MDKIIQDVYNTFMSRMNKFYDNYKHVFLGDYYEDTLNFHKDDLKNMKKKKLNYNPIDNITDINCVKEPTKVLSLEEAKDIYDEYIKLDKQKDIEKLLDKNANYYLSGTVNELKVEKGKTNILIVGSGPSGMFVALYLNYLYSNRVNIQLIDTRIKDENVRMPFSRNRYFGVHSDYVFPLIYGFGCFSDYKQRVGMRIKHLELLFYCVCVYKKINILFTQKYKTFDKLKEILPKYDIVFDCSGNRLDYKITKNIPKFDTIKENDMIIKQNGNEVEVEWKKIVPVIYFLHIEVLNKKMETISSPMNGFFSLEKKEDIELFKKYTGCYKKNDAIKIVSAVKDKKTREMINYEIKGEYIKMEYFEVKQRHKLLITDYIGKTLYIASGDTAFYSHFYTGAGLERMYKLTAHICHLLDLMIKN
jgi:hypothetical protein